MSKQHPSNRHPRQQTTRWALGLLTLVLVGGCAARRDREIYLPNPDVPGTGRVCVYRTAVRAIMGRWQAWYLDGRREGSIFPGLDRCVDTFVGRHLVRGATGKPVALEVALTNEQIVFVRFNVDDHGIYRVLVDAETTEQELKTLKEAQARREAERQEREKERLRKRATRKVTALTRRRHRVLRAHLLRRGDT